MEKRRESDGFSAKLQRIAVIVGVTLSLVIALATAATNSAITREVTVENKERIVVLEQKVDQKTVSRTEMDDVKARLSRMDDKLDRIIERQLQDNKKHVKVQF